MYRTKIQEICPTPRNIVVNFIFVERKDGIAKVERVPEWFEKQKVMNIPKINVLNVLPNE